MNSHRWSIVRSMFSLATMQFDSDGKLGSSVGVGSDDRLLSIVDVSPSCVVDVSPHCVVDVSPPCVVYDTTSCSVDDSLSSDDSDSTDDSIEN